MTRPTVVVLCEHGEAKPHNFAYHDEAPANLRFRTVRCPGGRVLEQAIIIERDENGEWPEAALNAVADALGTLEQAHWALDALASTQENQP